MKIELLSSILIINIILTILGIYFSFFHSIAFFHGSGIKIIHNAGFLSCCSVRLEKIIDYFNTNLSLPDVVDSSKQFKWYKQGGKKDITFEYFKSYQNIKLNIRNKADYHSSYQFKNYKKIDYNNIIPFVKKYFTPSDNIKEIVFNIEKKYKIDNYGNICVLFYRGNDKSTETKLSNYDDYLVKVNEIKAKNKNIKFLIQSDETEFIKEMLKKLPNSFYFKDEIRHIKKQNSTVDKVYKQSNYKYSKFYLAITIIMSRCKFIICGSGNCSIWIMFYRGNANNVYQYLENKWYNGGDLSTGRNGFQMKKYSWYEAKAPQGNCVSKKKSQSQLNQDMWVLEQTNCKRGGYYIDIGAADGQDISNTAVLDNQFGWKGLCIDPYPKNMENRTCSIAKAVLYDKSGVTVKFKTADYLGGITDHIKGEYHKKHTKNSKEVSHITKTAQEVFTKYEVPYWVDYLNMDVEGAELKILQGMASDGTFSKHRFGAITIEHNYIEPERTKIRTLLEKHGYIYVGSDKFDDMYIIHDRSDGTNDAHEQRIGPSVRVRRGTGSGRRRRYRPSKESDDGCGRDRG